VGVERSHRRWVTLGIAEGDVFARVRETLKLPRQIASATSGAKARSLSSFFRHR
jgi:hypothetical protein